MDNLDFFLGERSCTFLRKLYRGKAQLKWTVTERWDERLGRSLNCGMERTYKLKKLLGVSTLEREDLESTVSNSIGKKGLFELKAEVKHKLTKELRLEETWEEEEEFHFQAPKCGRLTLRVYQLKRLHEFSYQDNRFWLWRKDNFKRTITEWVNHLYDNSVIIDVDPACSCDDGGGNGIEGLVNISFDRFGMLVGYKHTDRGLEVPSLKLVLADQRIEEILFKSIDFDTRKIPSHLLFLLGETSMTLTGRFQPLSSTTFSEAIGYFVGRQPSPPLEIEGSQKSQSDSTNFIYLLLGVASGAGAALLFTPKSGEELRGDIADATRRGIERSKEAAQQLGAKASEYYDTTRAEAGEIYDTTRETAGEYYEATRERATELYDTATREAGEVVTKTRDVASRQAGSISAAVEAGKKAYVEEKRKAELSGRTEATPTYKPEKAT